MVLYSYMYDKTFNEITIKSVEVLETANLYKVKSRQDHLANYVSQVRKDSLDTVIVEYSIYMVSQQCDVDRFKHMVAEQLEKERQVYLNKANDVLKTIDDLSKCKIIDKSNKGDTI